MSIYDKIYDAQIVQLPDADGKLLPYLKLYRYTEKSNRDKSYKPELRRIYVPLSNLVGAGTFGGFYSDVETEYQEDGITKRKVETRNKHTRFGAKLFPCEPTDENNPEQKILTPKQALFLANWEHQMCLLTSHMHKAKKPFLIRMEGKVYAVLLLPQFEGDALLNKVGKLSSLADIIKIWRACITAFKQEVLPAPLIHRDIKSANIVISADNQNAHIVDFGLAYPTAPTQRPYFMSGTPFYYAYEQIFEQTGAFDLAHADTEYKRQKDIFSLVMSLVEVASQRQHAMNMLEYSHYRDNNSALNLYANPSSHREFIFYCLDRVFANFYSLPVQLSNDLQTALESYLHRDATQRPQDMSALEAILDAIEEWSNSPALHNKDEAVTKISHYFELLLARCDEAGKDELYQALLQVRAHCVAELEALYIAIEGIPLTDVPNEILDKHDELLKFSAQTYLTFTGLLDSNRSIDVKNSIDFEYVTYLNQSAVLSDNIHIYCDNALANIRQEYCFPNMDKIKDRHLTIPDDRINKPDEADEAYSLRQIALVNYITAFMEAHGGGSPEENARNYLQCSAEEIFIAEYHEKYMALKADAISKVIAHYSMLPEELRQQLKQTLESYLFIHDQYPEDLQLLNTIFTQIQEWKLKNVPVMIAHYFKQSTDKLNRVVDTLRNKTAPPHLANLQLALTEISKMAISLIEKNLAPQEAQIPLRDSIIEFAELTNKTLCTLLDEKTSVKEKEEAELHYNNYVKNHPYLDIDLKKAVEEKIVTGGQKLYKIPTLAHDYTPYLPIKQEYDLIKTAFLNQVVGFIEMHGGGSPAKNVAEFMGCPTKTANVGFYQSRFLDQFPKQDGPNKLAEYSIKKLIALHYQLPASISDELEDSLSLCLLSARQKNYTKLALELNTAHTAIEAAKQQSLNLELAQEKINYYFGKISDCIRENKLSPSAAKELEGKIENSRKSCLYDLKEIYKKYSIKENLAPNNQAPVEARLSDEGKKRRDAVLEYAAKTFMIHTSLLDKNRPKYVKARLEKEYQAYVAHNPLLTFRTQRLAAILLITVAGVIPGMVIAPILGGPLLTIAISAGVLAAAGVVTNLVVSSLVTRARGFFAAPEELTKTLHKTCHEQQKAEEKQRLLPHPSMVH